MTAILKVDTIQDTAGNNIINESSDTITIGASGDTITVPTGASLTSPGLTLSDNILFNTASKGIYLGVTSATAANLLDDFEEGNHAAAFTTSSGSITIGRNDLFYTKIGRQVTLTGEIDISSVSSPVSPRLSLPFVIGSPTVDRNMNFGAYLSTYSVPFNADNQAVSIYGNTGNSYVSFLYLQDNGAFAAYTAAASDTFFINFTYFTN